MSTNPHVSYATVLATGDVDEDGNLSSQIKPTSRSRLYHPNPSHNLPPSAILTPYLSGSGPGGMPPHPSLFSSSFSLEDNDDDGDDDGDEEMGVLHHQHQQHHHRHHRHHEDGGDPNNGDGDGDEEYATHFFITEGCTSSDGSTTLIIPPNMVNQTPFDVSTVGTASPGGSTTPVMVRRLSNASSSSACSIPNQLPLGTSPQLVAIKQIGGCDASAHVTPGAKKSLKRVISIPGSMDAFGSFYLPDYYRRLTTNARTHSIRNIIHSTPDQLHPQSLEEQNGCGKKYYRTAEELAADEVKAGIEAMMNSIPKPIPTFTRCHFNTNWVPVDVDDIESNPLAKTIWSEQKRVNIDERFDKEKRDISFKYLNCLRLRREFVWSPSIYDRRAYDVHSQPPDYTPELDCKTINRIDASQFNGVATHRTDLQHDLLNHPDNYIFGFVDGVVHVYPKSIIDDLHNYEADSGMTPSTANDDSMAKSFKGYSPLVAKYGAALLKQQRNQHQKALHTSTTGGGSGNASPASFTSTSNKPSPATLSKSSSAKHPSSRTAVLTSNDDHHKHEKPTTKDAQSSNKQQHSNNTTSTTNTKPKARLPLADDKNITPVPTWHDFCDALTYILTVATDGPCKTWSHSRLSLLEIQKNIHTQMNHSLELSQSKAVPHRDFYNVRKIDNHVHHSACMNQKHLLRFIKKKLREPEANTRKIIERDGKQLTLHQVFKSLNLTSYDLSIDTLDMHATQTFHRFDKFNMKYNPIGESRLREIFLKYNNKIKGEYLAEVTKEVLHDLEVNKYQYAEYRMSIYGKEMNEWDALADWIIDFKLISGNVRWMIQIPRLYAVYKRSKCVNSLQDMLNNIFIPLFSVTLNPSSNPKLHQLLSLIVGFDTVDDESVRTKFFDRNDPPPAEWRSMEDPHYCAFMYYLYANLHALNQLREMLHLNTFELRPHAGEAGDIEHVAAAFLCARGINHGLTLFKCPPLQYLYYLSQTGISMSPLSNNLLFLEYQKNPFPKFFSRGLNVTLSTDDPLMIHVTKEPLVEEYSVASQVWKLSHIDLCEIARNSVLQSGFEHRYKVHWLGNRYWKRNVEGNDIRCTNVPDIRIQYRWELLYSEHRLLTNYADNSDVFDYSLIDPLY